MTEEAFGRRDFLKGAVVGGAAAATTRLEVTPAQAQPATPVPAAGAGSPAMGYACLNLDEAAFVEALVDHMIPADELTPERHRPRRRHLHRSRARRRLGQGRPALHAGPVEEGHAEPGLPAPARPRPSSIAPASQATNAYCRKTYGKSFDRLDAQQQEEVLRQACSTGKIDLRRRPAGARLLRPCSTRR